MKDKEKMNEIIPITQLIQEAMQMYQDRPKIEADLIYYIATMHDEERTALILAYDLLYKTEE